MRLVTITCPHCGANATIDADNPFPKCDYCGSTIVVKDLIGNSNEGSTSAEDIQGSYSSTNDENLRRPHVNPIVTGYSDQTPDHYENKYRYTEPAPVPVKKKRRTWLWVLGWIFIFPVPLTILLLRKKDMNPILKYAIIVIAWLFYLGIGAGGNSASGKELSQIPYNPGYAAVEYVVTDYPEIFERTGVSIMDAPVLFLSLNYSALFL